MIDWNALRLDYIHFDRVSRRHSFYMRALSTPPSSFPPLPLLPAPLNFRPLLFASLQFFETTVTPYLNNKTRTCGNVVICKSRCSCPHPWGKSLEVAEGRWPSYCQNFKHEVSLFFYGTFKNGVLFCFTIKISNYFQQFRFRSKNALKCICQWQ
jgi:hypothetical protein